MALLAVPTTCSDSEEKDACAPARRERSRVHRRDRGLCELCGVQTRDQADAYWSMLARGRREEALAYLRGQVGAHRGRRVKQTRVLSGNLFDVDHRIPVQAGGGDCGLGNLRTLCIICHKQVTKQQAHLRAVHRSIAARKHADERTRVLAKVLCDGKVKCAAGSVE